MTQHLLLFPERATAEQIASELTDEGFTDVRVLRVASAGRGTPALSAGADNAEDHEWGVHVREDMVEDESGPVESGLRDRFAALAEEHHGSYDPEPTTD